MSPNQKRDIIAIDRLLDFLFLLLENKASIYYSYFIVCVVAHLFRRKLYGALPIKALQERIFTNVNYNFT